MEDWVKDIDIICFDADDTLWYDSIYFRRLEIVLIKICSQNNINENIIMSELRRNMKESTRGEAGFINAIYKSVLNLKLSKTTKIELDQQIEIFRNHPIEILPDVETFLKLNKTVTKFVITKGVFEEQINKLIRSNLMRYFENVIILSHKNNKSINNAINLLDVSIKKTLFIGNSVKHDIIPAISIGLKAIWLNHAFNSFNINDQLPSKVVEVQNWGEIITIFEKK